MASSEPPPDAPSIFYVGHHDTERSTSVSNQLFYQGQDAGYDMLTTPITNASFHNRVLTLIDTYLAAPEGGMPIASAPMPLLPSLTPEFTSLTPDESLSSLLAMTSPWIDLGSSDPVVAHVSLQVLTLEIAYAAFCGVNNIIVKGPSLDTTERSQYARAIANALGIGPYLQIHILMPMDYNGETSSQGDHAHLASRTRQHYLAHFKGNSSDSPDSLDAWDAWESVRAMCKYHGRLSVALTIPKNLPHMDIQSRWYSEPLRILNFPATTFVQNQKAYPVLSKPVQDLLTRYARLRQTPWILLSDVGAIPGQDGSNLTGSATGFTPSTGPTPSEAATAAARLPVKDADPTAHLRYIRHLQQTQPPRPVVDRFAAGYQDYLQSPLQPLTDNLESITYEVFEKDPVKYAWYERATAAALIDLHKKLNRPIVVAVVGAGRGPLVTRALRASNSTGTPIEMHAVEKNPNAYVLLLHHNATDRLWNKRVQVTKSDMRSWAGPTNSAGKVGKVDLLISELLGSFADNELSPECLDGVQHVLAPEHGVSIPQSYTAHLTPIATPKIYADLLTRTGDERWEVPYVVMLSQFDFLCRFGAAGGHAGEAQGEPDIQTAWEFKHPVPEAVLDQARLRKGGSAAGGGGGILGGDGANEHNSRSCRLAFKAQKRGLCHGLGGYFETVLYESEDQGRIVELSTNPNTMDVKSRDMISWFPIFFPLKAPLSVPDNAEMEVSLWRQTDDRKVWYEWIVEVFVRVGSKKQSCGVSELHSSWKNGCMM